MAMIDMSGLPQGSRTGTNPFVNRAAWPGSKMG